MNWPLKPRLPRVEGMSRYSFFIGAMMSAPNLTWWLPRSQDSVFEVLDLIGVLELRHEVRRARAAGDR